MARGSTDSERSRIKEDQVPEALSWLGMRIDDAYGAHVGAVRDVYLEMDGSPRWIFTGRQRVLIPADDAIAGAGRVWVPYERTHILGAPRVWSVQEVTPELEAQTRRWYALGRDHSGWATHATPV
jgi:hypothetical protein